MSKEIRRLHRKKKDFTNFSSSEPAKLPDSTESTEHSVEQVKSDTGSSHPQITDYYSSANINDISSIRAEFLEDAYHDKLSESDFSDDTHDWGGDRQNHSSDYWHFLGRYE